MRDSKQNKIENMDKALKCITDAIKLLNDIEGSPFVHDLSLIESSICFRLIREEERL